jgi:hypothetical protein
MLVHLQDRDQSIVFARPAVGTATTPHNVTALRASIIKRLTMILAVVDTIDGRLLHQQIHQVIWSER